MKGAGIKVDIKDPDFKVISRQKQLAAPTNLAEEIFRAVSYTHLTGTFRSAATDGVKIPIQLETVPIVPIIMPHIAASIIHA